jgi:hypothetical protein
MKWRMTKSRRPFRGLDVRLCHIPGVPLTLHPRLYSDARVRGLKYNIRDLCKNLGNDKVFPAPVRDQRGWAGNTRPTARGTVPIKLIYYFPSVLIIVPLYERLTINRAVGLIEILVYCRIGQSTIFGVILTLITPFFIFPRREYSTHSH